MSKILVFGHQNPDTDAIGAAIAFSHLQNELIEFPARTGPRAVFPTGAEANAP